MMFSKSCEYAIRATVYIALKTKRYPKVGIDEICSHIEAPRYFTAKILQTLTKDGIVHSQKGVNGGFYIDASQRANPIRKIVVAIDGEKIFTGCGLGLKQCSEKKPCPLHSQFKAIRDALGKMMNETTVDMLALRLEKGETVLIH